MSIIYVLVAKHANNQMTTLVSYETSKGNYASITQTLLSKLKNNQNISIPYDEKYTYHVLQEKGVYFVCLAENQLKLKFAFAFLEKIKNLFRQKYTNEDVASAIAFQFSPNFAPILGKQLKTANECPEQDKLQLLNKQLGQLKDIMVENIDKVLQRGQKVDLFVQKAAKNDALAETYRGNARKVKQHTYWQRNKFRIFMGVSVIAIISCVCLFLFL